MNTEIINLYVDRILNEVTESLKTRLLLETQLKYTESLNVQLQTKITELEKKIETLNKKKTKEVATSDQF
jgi:phage shock protein A